MNLTKCRPGRGSVPALLGFTLGWAAATAHAVQDNTPYVNMVQNANGVYHTAIHRTVLMRYPCGRVGSWSIDQGEFIVVLKVAPSVPMEFLTVKLIQSGGQLALVEA